MAGAPADLTRQLQQLGPAQVLTHQHSQPLWNTACPSFPSSPWGGADVSSVFLVSLKRVPDESQEPPILSYHGKWPLLKVK